MMTQTEKKRPLQVALALPADLEERIREGAKTGFRTVAKEIAMRLVQQDAGQEEQSKQGAAA